MANNGADSNDCNRTMRVSRGRVRVNEGQHLHYFVTVEGATPVFSLACTHKKHFDAASLGAPRKNYEVIWERTSADETGEARQTVVWRASKLPNGGRVDSVLTPHSPAEIKHRQS